MTLVVGFHSASVRRQNSHAVNPKYVRLPSWHLKDTRAPESSCVLQTPSESDALAMVLLAEFGSVFGVLCARRSRLAACLPSHPAIVALLFSTASVIRHGLTEQMLAGPLLPDLSAVLDYLRIDLERLPFERARVLYLSARHHLISDEIICEGGLDSTSVAPRQIVGRALELAAAGVVLAHNHPSGDPTPSKADIDLTRRINLAGQPLGVSVLEHIVIGLLSR